MAREFFKDLPNTTTPLNATRLNGLLDGEEPMGNLVVDSIRSKNMFDKNNVINGYTFDPDGNIFSANGYSYQPIYIPVESSTTYTISSNVSAAGNYRIAEYNSSYGFILRDYNTSGNTTMTITTNENTKYVRISALTSSLSTLQFEKGSTATSYSLYQELNNQEVYSTSEIRIGTWTDGKPLYRKCYNVSSLPNNTTSQIINLSGISNKDFVRINYGASWSTWGSPRTYPVIRNGLEIYISSSKNVDCATSGSIDWSIWSAFVVIEYTKTTD